MAATDIPDTGAGTVALLARMQDELEATFFSADTPPAAKAALSRQLMIVRSQLVQAIGDEDDRALDHKLTAGGTEAFDPKDV